MPIEMSHEVLNMSVCIGMIPSWRKSAIYGIFSNFGDSIYIANDVYAL